MIDALKIFAAENCMDTIMLGRICDDCHGAAIFKLIALVIDIMSIGIGILAVIGIIIAGIQYMTSGDNPATLKKAKSRIFNIVLGLAAYSVMFAFLQFLLPGGLIRDFSGSGGDCPATPGIPDPSPVTPEPSDPSPGSGGGGSPIGQRDRACGPVTTGALGTESTVSGVRAYTASNGRSYYIWQQEDARWKDKTINGTSTMGKSGCHRTTIAIIDNSFATKTIYPDPDHTTVLNATSGNLATSAPSGCSGTLSEKIRCVIDEGGAVMVNVCTGDKCPDSGNHFFAIVDWHNKGGKIQYYLANTIDGAGNSPTRRIGWQDASEIDPYICKPAGTRSCRDIWGAMYYLPKNSSLKCK